MTFAELKESLKSYLDEISGENPSDRDIEILGMIEDYAEPEGISEEDIQARITEAVTANDTEWRKKFKDRFYGRDVEKLADEKEQPETVEDTVVVDDEPEQEEFKSILDFEW